MYNVFNDIISHFAKEVQWIPSNELENTTVTGQEIILKDSGSTYEWDGKTVGGEKVYEGKSCMPLALDVSSNDECVFSFDKQLLMDFGVQLHSLLNYQQNDIDICTSKIL